jgi:hypothetical protein
MPQLRGHWSDRLAAIDQDLAALQQYQSQANPPRGLLENVTSDVLSPPRINRPSFQHTPVVTFQPGQPISIELHTPAAIESARLWYRHVDQAERYLSQEMQQKDSSFIAAIDGSYTQSPFAIQYYFESRGANGAADLHPGFSKDFCGQPYFVIQRR